jgi:hypothetical protein
VSGFHAIHGQHDKPVAVRHLLRLLVANGYQRRALEVMADSTR